MRGDDATLRRLIANARVRGNIARFGTSVQDKGNISVHITPSFTLSISNAGYLGAEFNIAGKTHHGNVQAPQTVYFTRRAGQQVLVQDQPDEEW
jgi:hypothetical protein